MSQTMTTETFDDMSASQRVIEAVADETGDDLTEVGPLYHVIDPDALDRLFAPTNRTGRTEGFVEFTFAGCDVVVRGDGTVDATRRGIDAETESDAHVRPRSNADR
ncbi:hypothetical protein NGM10_03405 [Halorussus salilacus]|uniref:HalOD1 output domain-containing protein n=1 Tax=Halorussus salilacus TaxID=2953750 RepID=UPI0020A0EDA8|nr:HalOD1 output domain-containing protein [Halorussus salilacus]USZ68790.1 hypothetical protein NGM10_03405 [Halorussus salilacus]